MTRPRHPAALPVALLMVACIAPVALWCASMTPRPVRWTSWRRRRAAGRDGRR